MAIHGIFIANKPYKKRCWRYARYCSWVIECLFFSLCWFHNIWQEKKCWLVSIQLLVPSIIPPTNTSLFWISNFFLLFIQENMELRFETEQATKDCPRLKVSFLWLLFWSSDCWIVAFTVFWKGWFSLPRRQKSTATMKLTFYNYNGFSRDFSVFLFKSGI